MTIDDGQLSSFPDPRSTLDEVIQATTIKFPRPLDGREQVEDLFRYLWQEGRLQTSYEVIESYYLGDIGKEPSATDVRELRFCGIKGSVKDSRTYATDHFGIKDTFDDSDQPLFVGLKFSIVPGRELREYREDVQNLWAKTRELTQKYFTEGPGKLSTNDSKNPLNLF